MEIFFPLPIPSAPLPRRRVLSLSLSPQHVTSRSRRQPWKLTVTAARLRRINQLPPQPSPFPLPLSLNFFLPKPKPNRSFPISRELRSKEEQGAAPDLAPPPSPGYPPSSPLVGSCGESPADLSCEFLWDYFSFFFFLGRLAWDLDWWGVFLICVVVWWCACRVWLEWGESVRLWLGWRPDRRGFGPFLINPSSGEQFLWFFVLIWAEFTLGIGWIWWSEADRSGMISPL